MYNLQYTRLLAQDSIMCNHVQSDLPCAPHLTGLVSTAVRRPVQATLQDGEPTRGSASPDEYLDARSRLSSGSSSAVRGVGYPDP